MGKEKVEGNECRTGNGERKRLQRRHDERNAEYSVGGKGRQQNGSDEPGHVSPHRHSLSEMQEEVEGEGEEECGPKLQGKGNVCKHAGSGAEQHDELFQRSECKGFRVESLQTVQQRSEPRKTFPQRATVIFHPTMLHSHFFRIVQQKSERKRKNENQNGKGTHGIDFLTLALTLVWM